MTTTTTPPSTAVQPCGYDLIIAAQKHLVGKPGDVGARGKLAEAFLAVGCPELAAEQLLLVRQSQPSLPGLDQALDVVQSQPSSAVPREELQRQLEQNVRLCCRRWPERKDLWSGLSLPKGLEVFQCADGNLQARINGNGGEPIWFAFADHLAAAGTTKLPPEAAHAAHDGYLVCPLAMGEVVVWLFNATRQGLNGLQQTIILVEPQLDNLAVNFAIRPWSELIGAPRVRLFAGPEHREQLLEAIRQDPQLSIPSYKLKLPTWPDHEPIDHGSLLRAMTQARYEVLQDLLRQVNAVYRHRDRSYWADRFANAGSDGQGPLRILGPTSLMTTVLQYSMRDWLAAFEQLGCQARLLTERGQHCNLTPAAYLQAIVEFEPDLVVIHDHYRPEYERWFPPNLPMLTWIQDRMPRLFVAGAGKKIGPLDFVSGMGKRECVTLYDYPFDCFVPVQQLTSEKTYYPLPPDQSVPSKYRCDVSYVSHAGMTIDQLVDQTVKCIDHPGAQRLVADLVKDLVDRYGHGEMLFNRSQLDQLLSQHEHRAGTRLNADHGRAGVLEFLLLKFNSPLLRQTVAGWLLDSELDVHLYGNGWETNPPFAPYARGVATNGEELRYIFQGSKINLQVQPFGAVHSRLLDGLASGGFFLIFVCPSDQIGGALRQLHLYAQDHNITDHRSMLACPDPQVQQWLRQVSLATGWNYEETGFDIVLTLRILAETDFTGAADISIPHYDDVAFRTRDELLDKIEYFLSHEQDRLSLASEMCQAVRRNFSYRHGTERMLSFVKNGLQKGARKATVNDPSGSAPNAT